MMQSSTVEPRWAQGRALWLAAAALVVLGVCCYGQVRGFQFVTNDDRLLIAESPLVRAWAQAPLSERLLTPGYGYAIPVTVASFALDTALFGSDHPGGFHLINLLLHLLATLVLLRVLLRLTLPAAALAGAALFLLHPVQAETVAFVTQRKDLLVVLFALLALDRTLALPPGRPRPQQALLVLLLVLAAGLAKPSGVLLGPLLGGLLFLWRGRRLGSKGPGQDTELDPRADRPLALALVLCGVALIALHSYVDSIAAMALDRKPLPWDLRIGLVGSTLRHYLSILLYPIGLTPKVPRPVRVDPAGLLLLAVTAGLLLFAARWAWRRDARRAQLLLGWLIATYLPIANLAPISRYAADCYLYAVLPALALGLALLLEQLAARGARLRTAGVLLIGVGLLVLGLRCHDQVAVWRDEETLFAYLHRLLPGNREAMREYAELLLRSGRREQGLSVMLDYYAQALRREPSSLAARGWLLKLYPQRGRPGDLEAAQQVLAEVPVAQRSGPFYQELRLEWALGRKDNAAALLALQELLRLRPDHPRAALLPSLQGAPRSPAP